jgi:hypothetical protein
MFLVTKYGDHYHMTITEWWSAERVMRFHETATEVIQESDRLKLRRGPLLVVVHDCEL